MSKITRQQVKDLLNQKSKQYNSYDFIESDPISIPHQYSIKQDIEITGLIAAVLAWGQRKTIINKCNEFFSYMDNAPYDFIINHNENDLKPFLQFVHRTFNATDALYFIYWLNWFYSKNESLEAAFYIESKCKDKNNGDQLRKFYNLFFSLEHHPKRTRKHIQTPDRKSACKRINMFLRWMVRKDESGVDFGIWQNLKSADLICPLDLHVDRVARKLNLIKRKQTDWLAALELTENLRSFDDSDPVKYDFALFGLGVFEKF